MDRRQFIAGASASALIAAAGGLPLMAIDPAIPATLGDQLRDLDRRLRNIERSPQLIASSIKGGTWRILDSSGDGVLASGELNSGFIATEAYAADGTTVVRMGEINNGAGIEVGNNPTGLSSDTFFAVTKDGVSFPYTLSSPYEADAFKVVTSGSFVAAWRWYFPIASYDLFAFNTVVTADVGTTGEIRLAIAGGATSTVVSVGSGATVVTDWRWGPSGVTVGSGPLTFALEARRTSGAGNINCYAPANAWMGSIPGATAGGT